MMILLIIRAHAMAVVWHYYLFLGRKRNRYPSHTRSRSHSHLKSPYTYKRLPRSRSSTCPPHSNPFQLQSTTSNPPIASTSDEKPKLLLLPSSHRTLLTPNSLNTKLKRTPSPESPAEATLISSRRYTFPSSQSNPQYRPNSHTKELSNTNIVVYAPILMSEKEAQELGGKEVVLVSEDERSTEELREEEISEIEEENLDHDEISSPC